jgi:hypothetical protein
VRSGSPRTSVASALAPVNEFQRASKPGGVSAKDGAAKRRQLVMRPTFVLRRSRRRIDAADQPVLSQLFHQPIQRAWSEQKGAGDGGVHLVQDLDARPWTLCERRKHREGRRPEREMSLDVRLARFRSFLHYLHYCM